MSKRRSRYCPRCFAKMTRSNTTVRGQKVCDRCLSQMDYDIKITIGSYRLNAHSECITNRRRLKRAICSKIDEVLDRHKQTDEKHKC